jgi:hypothetical protein
MSRGYLAHHGAKWILPCDEAQFWNFPRRGEQANCCMGGVQDGEKMVLSARDIAIGEELTIPPESDEDYDRKVENI